MTEDELAAIEARAARRHALDADDAEDLIAEVRRLRAKAHAWDRLGAACRPGAVDLTPDEKALILHTMVRAEEG